LGDTDDQSFQLSRARASTNKLRKLRLLTAAARGGSFVAAAEACHLTPPAVTMQLKATWLM
jgi:hypothetical protein